MCDALEEFISKNHLYIFDDVANYVNRNDNNFITQRNPMTILNVAMFANNYVSIYKTLDDNDKDHIFTAIACDGYIIYSDNKLDGLVDYLMKNTNYIDKKEYKKILGDQQ